ncbi:MAG: RloB domain-containing protein [Bacteroidales bacterium]|nr:RloB domain-containing protein [Bacteroidales bacterium]
MAIERRRDYGKKKPTRDTHKIYIVCEGSVTEPEYFRFFECLSSNLQVITIPSKDGKTDPLKLMESAKNKFLGDNNEFTIDYKQHDKIWFVIDTDKWEDENKIKPLRDFCFQQNKLISKKYDEIKSYTAWNVAQSNPCFEMWYYYHFYETPPKDFEGKVKFKTYLNIVLNRDFKIDRYDPERHPKDLETAIKNAKDNFHTDKDNKVALFSTEMYVLGTEILHFVKCDLDKLKNKMSG